MPGRALLVTAVLAALQAAAQTSLEFAVDPNGDAEHYRLERADAPGRWRLVRDFPVWTCRRTCTHVDELAPATTAWRVVPVDAVGNEGPPAYLEPLTASCTWSGEGFSVPVDCAHVAGADTCDCAAVLERLRAAAGELLSHELLEHQVLAGGLRGLRVRIVRAKVFAAPRGEQAEGLYDLERHVVILGADGGAALHELLHAALARAGIEAGAEGHQPWEASPLLRELDERFRARWRGKSVWAPRR
jgi:hypothetical protein